MTAANGAEDYYSLSSDDTIRNETARQASGLDQRLIEVHTEIDRVCILNVFYKFDAASCRYVATQTKPYYCGSLGCSMLYIFRHSLYILYSTIMLLIIIHRWRLNNIAI